MTVGELAKYFFDRDFFTNPDQKVKFVLSPDDVPIEKGTRLEMRGSVSSEQGEAVVAFRSARKRKYMFSLKFEANPIVEAESLEEAEKKAYELTRDRAVVNNTTGDDDDNYVIQEPYFLGEVKE